MHARVLEGCSVGFLSRMREEAQSDSIGSGRWPSIMGFTQVVKFIQNLFIQKLFIEHLVIMANIQ